jgi:hypothetical protein
LNDPTTLTCPTGWFSGRQNVTRVLLPNNLLRLITAVLLCTVDRSSMAGTAPHRTPNTARFTVPG